MGDKILGYEDDPVNRFIDIWDILLTAKGVKIGREKRHVMLVCREGEEIRVWIKGRILKQTDQFEYLGVSYGTKNDISM